MKVLLIESSVKSNN